MDKREQYSTAALSVLILVTIFLKLRGHPSVTPAVSGGVDEPSGQAAFAAPYMTSNPGIADNPVTLNGGAPFNSTINVQVNPSYLGSLSRQYIPMFGFVGVGTSTMPTSSSFSNAPAPAPLVAPPPAPATFAKAPAPMVMPVVYTQPPPFHPTYAPPPPPPRKAPKAPKKRVPLYALGT